MALVFVSHAAVDSVIAKNFQDNVKADFLGLCEVFVSSNLDSLHAGYEWNQVVKNNLSKCSILVGLLSPAALQRPWVYAEFGAGWIRDIPCIPVCHSGLDRGQLPAPLSNFQGLNLGEAEHLEHVYTLMSKAVGCQKPSVDFEERARSYAAITESARLERTVIAWIKQLFQWNPSFKSKILSGEVDEEVLIPSNLDQPFQEFAAEATSRNFLSMEYYGMAIGTRVGAQASVFKIGPGDKFPELRNWIEE